jgi:hypothetical protein
MTAAAPFGIEPAQSKAPAEPGTPAVSAAATSGSTGIGQPAVQHAPERRQANPA